MNRKRCSKCGLINAAHDEVCRRCGTSLSPLATGTAEDDLQKRGIARRLLWIFGATMLALFICYMSLLLTSTDLTFSQHEVVDRAIAVLELNGFAKQAFVLHHIVKYRGADSWWNRYVGHHSAYAATNFPFEVLTLYPEFFEDPVDDTERAAILLHESYHLFGSGEEAALEGVWRDKEKLGWTAKQYGQTKVWNSTRELTTAQVPALFVCGPDERSDCTQ